MYRSTGNSPGYGCSKYELEDGDAVEWLYTCDLGKDVGCLWTDGGDGASRDKPERLENDDECFFLPCHPAVLLLYFLVCRWPCSRRIPCCLLWRCWGRELLHPAGTAEGFLRNMAFYVPLFLMIAVTNPLFSQ